MTFEEVRSEVARLMDEIGDCFKPGVKITVLVRTPKKNARDFMMTNDEIDELQKMLERLKTPAQFVPADVEE